MTALQNALKLLSKNKVVDVKKAVVDLSDSQKPVPCISTGSVILDYLIGGYRTETGEKRCPGIPRGRITEIFGGEGCGKTTIATQVAVACQKAGGTVCYLDYEHAFAPTYAADLGLNIDPSSFALLQPKSWEEGAEIISAMIQSGVDLIVVDSLAAMKPQAVVDSKEVSAIGRIGHIAALQSDYLPKILNDLEESGTALIYINQLRSNIKTSMYDSGPDEETSGGKALKYYASLRIHLKKSRQEYAQVENELTGGVEKQPISNFVKAKNIKNKVSKHQGHQTEFVIRYGEGIDNVRSVIDIAETRKLVKRAGAWYSFTGISGEEIRHQGKENLREFLAGNSEEFYALVKQIQSFAQSTKIGKIVGDIEVVEMDDSEDFEEIVITEE
jgi:recombination protein RecA